MSCIFSQPCLIAGQPSASAFPISSLSVNVLVLKILLKTLTTDDKKRTNSAKWSRCMDENHKICVSEVTVYCCKNCLKFLMAIWKWWRKLLDGPFWTRCIWHCGHVHLDVACQSAAEHFFYHATLCWARYATAIPSVRPSVRYKETY